MKIKNKFWKIALAGLGISAGVASIGATLVSCASNQNSSTPNFYKADSSKHNVFKNDDSSSGSIASPSIVFSNYIKSLLMNPNVSNNFFDGVANLSVLVWFRDVAKVIPESKIADTYKNWLIEIGIDPFTNKDVPEAKNKGIAQEKIQEYKDKYSSSNWETYIQNDVYNAAGGSKLSWVQSLYLDKVKSEFIKLIFDDPTMLMMATDGTTNFELNNNFKSKVNDPKFVNGSGAETVNQTNAGTKNNFIFSADASDQQKDTPAYTIQKGFADFLDFALDQYIKTEMPLLSNMALFKPVAPVENDNSSFFNLNYFSKETVGTEGSYKFQCYKPSNGNQIGSYDVIGKWAGAIDQITPGQNYCVDPNTGVINISKNFTDDSSTYMVNNASSIFNDTVAPFAAAVAYKFNTIWATGATTGGPIDSNVPNLAINKVNTNQIMNNFIVYNQKGNDSKKIWDKNDFSNGNYLAFPYDTTLAFGGTNYEGATGIVDAINITDESNSKQTPFIITRDEFGIHIVGIDRYNALIAAIQKGASDKAAALQNLRNEIRNTATYRYAVYLTNDNDTVNGFNLKEKLQSYVTSNFNTLLLSYINTNTQNNLFQKLVLKNDGNPIKININKEILTAADSYRNYKNALNVQTNINTINSKIYENQSAYLGNTTPENWKNNGIAGVLPYSRNQTTGNFDSLIAVEAMTLLKPKNSSSGTTPIEKYVRDMSDQYLNDLAKIITNFNGAGEILVDSTITNSSQIFIKTLGKLDQDIGKGLLNALNKTIANVSADDFANPITLNRYVNYLEKQNILANSNVTNFDNLLNSQKIVPELKTAIENLFLINNFTNQKESYDHGNVSSMNDVINISKKIFIDNLSNNVGKYVQNNSQNIKESVYFSKNSNDSLDFYKFLLGLDYLIENNFKNFNNYLKEKVSYGDQAFISWVRSDSTKSLRNFGVDPNVDFAFKQYQPYLTKNNGYAYIGAQFDIENDGVPTKDTENKITYTEDTKYWNVAKNSDSKDYNGFYGLQTLNSNELPSVLVDGSSNGTNVFSNNVWENNFSSATSYNFTGSMYQYGSLNEYIKNKLFDGTNYKVNTISEFESIVKDFKEYNFDITGDSQKYSDDVDKYLDKDLINLARKNLNHGIQSFIAFIKKGNESSVNIQCPDQSGLSSPVNPKGGKTIPDGAFNQYKGNLYTTNLGNKSSSVFTDGTTYLGTEIYVEQINNTKIEKLIKSNGNITTPWTVLGISKELFYSLVVNAAMNPEIQNNGIKKMNDTYKKIDVYDVRLNDALPIVILSNYRNPNKENN